MMPHEKTAARHAAACDAIYRKLEKSPPRTWKPASSWSRVPKKKWRAWFAWGGAAVSAAATVLPLTRHLAANSGQAFLLASLFVCLGCLFGFFLGSVARNICLRLAGRPADLSDVHEVAAVLRAYPRLEAIAESWLALDGADVLTEHQVRRLKDAHSSLRWLNQEERNRVEGLAVLEKQLGVVGRARAAYRARQLGEALLEPSVVASTSRPRL